MSRRVLTGGSWSVEHSHVLAVGGLIVPCEPTCGIEQGHHEVRDVWKSDPRPLPRAVYEPVLVFRGDDGEAPE